MKNFYKWLYGFIGAMIMAWLGNYFYDSTKSIPLLKYITGSLNWFYNVGLTVMNYPIKLWIIIVTLIGIQLMYRALKYVTQEEPQPDFTNYRKDVFKKWIWRWDWKLTHNTWTPINLTPYCPVDDVQLISNGGLFNPRFYCPKCGIRFNEVNNPIETEVEAEVLLLDKVNKGTYPKS